jgi:hypothetical protein
MRQLRASILQRPIDEPSSCRCASYGRPHNGRAGSSGQHDRGPIDVPIPVIELIRVSLRLRSVVHHEETG